MSPASHLPLGEMWIDDPHWLPRILAGETLRATFAFNGEGKSLKNTKIASFTL